MMNIAVAREFTVTPGPRYRDDGKWSGEEFREVLLRGRFLEARERGEKLLIDLDGTAGYATSFLEEAFGGLAREFGTESVQQTLEFRSEEEPFLVEDVRGYINAAGSGSKEGQ